MIVSHLIVKNWRNFRHIDVDLRDRMFVVGPNASGKSNLLDIFRFLRDLARPEGGGLQKAVKDRGGLSKIRSLAARKDPEVLLCLTLREMEEANSEWRYQLGIGQDPRGHRQTRLTSEKVWHKGELLLDRPNEDDRGDPERLTQTYLEQINVNKSFRVVARFFQSTTYLHLVPQLLRFSELLQGSVLENDPFGQGFLERLAGSSEKIRRARLKLIESALKIAVPQLEQLEFMKDDMGRPHLQALYSHWRPHAGKQREDQFSDGTLRLIGLFWSLLEGDSLLLLEEPELSLNKGIVSQLAPLMKRLQRKRRRQLIVSTHSHDLLDEAGIDGREVLLLEPEKEGTTVRVAADIQDVRTLLENGLSVGEVVLPRVAPKNAYQLSLFNE